MLHRGNLECEDTGLVVQDGHFLSIRHKITTLSHSTHIAVCVWLKIQRLYLLHGGEMLVWQNLMLFCMQGIEKV